MKDLVPLTDQEERFAREYIFDRKGRQAALRADIPPSKATAFAARCLSDDVVRARINELIHIRNSDLDFEAADVLRELAKIGFSNLHNYIEIQEDGTAYVNLEDMDHIAAAAVSEITVEEYTEGRGEYAREIKRVKLKFYNKLDALKQLAQHHGLLKEQVDVKITKAPDIDETQTPEEAQKAFEQLRLRGGA